MKGVVFNIFEEFVVEVAGEDAFDDLVDACPHVRGVVHVSPKTYPDEQLYALVAVACERLGMTQADALRAFGRFAFPRLAARFPSFLAGMPDAATFLGTIDGVIHVEVGKLLEGSVLPRIQVQDLGQGRYRAIYASPRKLCALFEGLLQGVADHFHTPIEARQSGCAHDGASACTFELRIDPPGLHPALTAGV
jgi:Haem-NO-binding